MKTAYKYPIRSPFQATNRNSFNVQDKKHPVRTEIQKFIGSYQIGVEFQEDQETLLKFRHIPGIIAVLCTLRKDGQVIGLGRGVAVVNRVNRIVERTVSMAINGSFMSAANNATKVLDTLRLDMPAQAPSQGIGEAYKAGDGESSDTATLRQVEYLKTLISTNIEDDSERERFLANIDQLTKGEASEMIQKYADPR